MQAGARSTKVAKKKIKRAVGAKKAAEPIGRKSKSPPVPKFSDQSEEKSPKVNPFHQRLARLTHYQACKLLGGEGKSLLIKGNQEFEIETERDVFLGGDLYRVRVLDSAIESGLAVVTITLSSARDKQLLVNCDQCTDMCIHAGGAIHHLLDAKSTMGLAAPPDETVPLENLTEAELLQRVLADRQKRAKEEKMAVRALDKSTPWTDYVVNSVGSGKTYRVALRGTEPGDSYCSCPDFRTNHLGTCKHILHTLTKVTQRFSSSKIRQSYQRKNFSIRVSYKDPIGLLINVPNRIEDKVAMIVGDSHECPIDGHEMMNRIQAIEQAGYSVHVYPDAEEMIQRCLVQKRLAKFCNEIRKSPKTHPLRKGIAKRRVAALSVGRNCICRWCWSGDLG